MKIAILFASFAGASAFVSQAPKSVGYVFHINVWCKPGRRRCTAGEIDASEEMDENRGGPWRDQGGYLFHRYGDVILHCLSCTIIGVAERTLGMITGVIRVIYHA